MESRGSSAMRGLQAEKRTAAQSGKRDVAKWLVTMNPAWLPARERTNMFRRVVLGVGQNPNRILIEFLTLHKMLHAHVTAADVGRVAPVTALSQNGGVVCTVACNCARPTLNGIRANSKWTNGRGRRPKTHVAARWTRNATHQKQHMSPRDGFHRGFPHGRQTSNCPWFGGPIELPNPPHVASTRPTWGHRSVRRGPASPVPAGHAADKPTIRKAGNVNANRACLANRPPCLRAGQTGKQTIAIKHAPGQPQAEMPKTCVGLPAHPHNSTQLKPHQPCTRTHAHFNVRPSEHSKPKWIRNMCRKLVRLSKQFKSRMHMNTESTQPRFGNKQTTTHPKQDKQPKHVTNPTPMRWPGTIGLRTRNLR